MVFFIQQRHIDSLTVHFVFDISKQNSFGNLFDTVNFDCNGTMYDTYISCRDTRSTNCNQLYTPKPNGEHFRKSFMYSGAAIWNSLPLKRPLNY